MAKIFDFTVTPSVGDAQDWLPDYPNPPDFRFDYYKLLNLAREQGNAIGQAPPSRPLVAIVGGGVAGMTAARELHRCGYRVVIFEASDRLCGRHYTIPLPDQTTAMEMGAMRFPYFSKPGSGNCLFDYYLTTEAQAAFSSFPNPGAAPGNTGIYMNEGWGPAGEFYPAKRLIPWPESSSPYNPPPDPHLKAVYDKVYNFVNFFSTAVSQLYTGSSWPQTWEQIANRYEKMSVSDLVFTPAILQYANDGWFGGFGMDAAQSDLFYTIGSGDGSWGAFYEIGAMWFIRCVMFGFNSNLQSLLGILDKQGLPYYNDRTLKDTAGQPLTPPLYVGIQTLTEWLLYQKAPGSSKSLYQAATDPQDDSAYLYINHPVTGITKTPQGLCITHGQGDAIEVLEVDYAVMTSTLWAAQLSLDWAGFNIHTELPLDVLTARSEQHNITSCKVFFPLNATYWELSPIPQILITDTFVQDAYGVKWDPQDAGALLASYTWEDDAVKLLPYSDQELAHRVLTKLNEITLDTVGEAIGNYVDAAGAVVLHWAQQPTYHGCAKLYRQRNWQANYALLTYNQEHSPFSRLYFAGENYSVEGGWTEPALRLAIDAVMHLLHNSGGTFNNGFNYAQDYPRYDVTFQPDQVDVNVAGSGMGIK